MADPAAFAPIPLRRELVLAASAAQLWPLVSNTDRLNRSLGLPPLTLDPATPGQFSRKAHARLYGLAVTWREPPFEWVEGRYYRAVREFENGPLARFEGGVELVPEGAGTRVIVTYTFTPRHALGALLVRWAPGRWAIEDAQAMLRGFEASLKGGGAAFPARRTKTLPNTAVLAQKTQKLHDAPVDRAAASRLLHFIDHAYDDELGRMRPFELADRWGVERLETLRVFLHATKAGLLDMNWEVLCPHCAAPQAMPASLAAVGQSGHCTSCDVDYSVNFDESIELRFSISPAVRRVETRVFCAGSPMHTPFAAVQMPLPPAGKRDLELDLDAESYVLRDLEAKTQVSLRPSAQGPSVLAIDLARPEGALAFKPGRVRLALAAAGRPALARLERESWRQRGATAGLVTSLQEFRDLFSSDVLAPGVAIGVKTLTVMFSDLKESTALYESVGNAGAYAIVRDHFGYLLAIVKDHNGAVVKTIGDAVMAVFSRPGDAVAAAFEIQERIGTLNGKLAPRPSVVVKLGLHQGPAIAINAGGILDYFGTTVNVAARVQNESQGGDLVLTEALACDPAVAELFSRHRFEHETLRLKLKGLSDVFTLRRVIPERRADA